MLAYREEPCELNGESAPTQSGAGMTLDEVLDKSTTWGLTTFPDETVMEVWHHLQMEHVELRVADFKDPLEFADCFMLLADLLKRSGFTFEDLKQAIIDKLEINRQRTWEKRGKTYGHVKEEQG